MERLDGTNDDTATWVAPFSPCNISSGEILEARWQRNGALRTATSIAFAGTWLIYTQYSLQVKTDIALHKQILTKHNKFTAGILILPLTTTNVLLEPGFLGYGALSFGKCCLMFQGNRRPSKRREPRTQWHGLIPGDPQSSASKLWGP